MNEFDLMRKKFQNLEEATLTWRDDLIKMQRRIDVFLAMEEEWKEPLRQVSQLRDSQHRIEDRQLWLEMQMQEMIKTLNLKPCFGLAEEILEKQKNEGT